MKRLAWRIAVTVVVAGVACGRGAGDRESAMNADLKRDLAAASAVGVELANSAQGYRAAQVVSAIEQSEQALPVQRRPIRKPSVRQPSSSDAETQKAPDPAPDVAVESPRAPEPQQPDAGAADAPTVPVVAPRPAPLPVEYPSAEGNRRGSTAGEEGGIGSGPDLGTVIGVIIRGGGIGDDHCVPRRPPRSGPRGNGFPIPGTIFNPGGTPQTIRGVPIRRPRGRF